MSNVNSECFIDGTVKENRLHMVQNLMATLYTRPWRRRKGQILTVSLETTHGRIKLIHVSFLQSTA